MSTVPCTECPGQLLVGKYSPITVPMADDEGFPVLDPATGRAKTITLRLPQHQVILESQGPSAVLGFEPGTRQQILLGDKAVGPKPMSVFDPTGLSPSLCTHGLSEHPNGFPLQHGGQSFIRSKYLRWDMMCVVCHGEERPDDFTTPRNA